MNAICRSEYPMLSSWPVLTLVFGGILVASLRLEDMRTLHRTWNRSCT